MRMKATDQDGTAAAGVAVGHAVVVSAGAAGIGRRGSNDRGKAVLRSQNLLLALLAVPIPIIGPTGQVINLPIRIFNSVHRFYEKYSLGLITDQECAAYDLKVMANESFTTRNGNF
jgi:hypothetical protein